MERYIVRRLIQTVIVLLIISMMVFMMGRLTGNPVALLLTEYSTEEDKIRLTKQLGLDRPLPQQYAIFLVNAIRGDLGRSIRGDRAPALKLILEGYLPLWNWPWYRWSLRWFLDCRWGLSRH